MRILPVLCLVVSVNAARAEPFDLYLNKNLSKLVEGKDVKEFGKLTPTVSCLSAADPTVTLPVTGVPGGRPLRLSARGSSWSGSSHTAVSR